MERGVDGGISMLELEFKEPPTGVFCKDVFPFIQSAQFKLLQVARSLFFSYCIPYLY